jgi:tryptophan synthase alpha chain
MTRFPAAFERLRREGACGLFPYVTAGYPDIATSQAIIEVALDVGADGFEIGVPFSDPLADGATMQRANAKALERGATLDTALDLARLIRCRSEDTPVALMSYYNPLRQRGEAQFAADMVAAGADGAIVPDLPPEESGALHEAFDLHGLAVIPFLAPTSPVARIQAVAILEPAFIYCVALTGVTGARQDLSANLGEFLARVRAHTSAPLVVGFGISEPEHVRRVAELGGSGVIVASALTNLVERSPDPIDSARVFLAHMKDAAQPIHRGRPTPASP